jgi:mannose PTS system EIIA component
MIGIVLVAHGGLAQEFIKTVGEIIGNDLQAAIGVSVDAMDDPEIVTPKIEKAIKDVDQGEGVLIFTDMFGGSPSHLALRFLRAGHIDVISGVNLPMLLEAFLERENTNLSILVQSLQTRGKESISLASEDLSR